MRKLLGTSLYLQNHLFLLVWFSLTLYFCFHLVFGPRGYLTLQNLEEDIVRLEDQNNQIIAEREAIERKVVMMRPGSIDRDLLEERARYVLGYMEPDEYVLRLSR